MPPLSSLESAMSICLSVIPLPRRKAVWNKPSKGQKHETKELIQKSSRDIYTTHCIAGFETWEWHYDHLSIRSLAPLVTSASAAQLHIVGTTRLNPNPNQAASYKTTASHSHASLSTTGTRRSLCGIPTSPSR
jgi:hypothetical protein